MPVMAIGPAWAGLRVARSRGLKVEVDPLGLEPEALWQAARTRGIPRAVYQTDPATIQVRDADGADWRAIRGDDWEEMDRWQNR